MRKLLIILFLFCSYGMSAQTKTGYCSLDFTYFPEKKLNALLDSAVIYVRIEEIVDRTQNIMHKDFDLDKGTRSFHVDSLPYGKYFISLSTETRPDKNSVDHTLLIARSVRADLNEPSMSIKVSFPEACVYHEHIYDKRCPKCKRSDKVIPVVYGLPVFSSDNEEEVYEAGCERTVCVPYWYCKRDKKQF